MAMEKIRTASSIREEIFALQMELALMEAERQEIDELIANSERPDAERDALVERLIAKEGAKAPAAIRTRAQRERGAHRARRILPRIGAGLACLLLLGYLGMSVAIAAVPAVRAEALRFIAHIGDGFVTFYFANADRPAQMPENWTGAYFPAHIPQGFALQSAGRGTALFRDEKSNVLTFSEYGLNEYTMIDTQGAALSTAEINGMRATVIHRQEAGMVFVVWAVGDEYFEVSLDGSVEEAVKIARSVASVR